MTRQPLWRPRPSTSLTSGLLLIAVAIALITLSDNVDGFVQGLLGGAGVMLALIGVAALSPLVRRRLRRGTRSGGAEDESAVDDPDPAADDADSDRGWLPSRDSRL
ncbi:MAG TPA: hypothetical protein VEX57_21240 [Microlunatus sp.]|nr:hypothetical protein [Microlunatus sp.]